MIYTNEPANQFYVYLTAYRAVESKEVNEKMLKGMISEIRKYPGIYGVIESTTHTGCFREAGQDVASTERTIVVRARNKTEVDNLAYLACDKYGQDAVLVVNSQTHTAALWAYVRVGIVAHIFLRHTPLNGTFQKVDEPTGECYTLDDAGYFWEVLQ